MPVRAGHATDGKATAGSTVAGAYSPTAQLAVLGVTLEVVDVSENTTGSVFLSLM